ncbi:MAG: hypothetical protein IPJ71_11365 [Bdellovibrionales bacterium]|nr:hypothetical protein [Bdellovibrionales bacterium]
MNKLLVVLMLASGGTAFAEGSGHATSPMHASKKVSKDEQKAKKACLTENKNLKGDELKKCIESKSL